MTKRGVTLLVLLFVAVYLTIFAASPCNGDDILHAEINVIGISDRTINRNLIGTNLNVGYERDIDIAPKMNHFLRLGPGKQISLNPYLVNLCREASFSILRFPGGCTSDAYHWREGVGPLGKRPLGKDESGTKMKHYLGTLEFARISKVIGADMIITANYKTGTPQEAANWVEFCNSESPGTQPVWTEKAFSGTATPPKGYFAWLRAQHGHADPLRVKYWEIGNEILFHKEFSYLSRAGEYSRLMKAVDSTIKVGVNIESFLYMGEAEIRKTAIPKDTFDFLTIHYYGSVTTKKPQTNFYSNAESSRSFTVDKAGYYEILVEAHGTRAIEWPRMSLSVNGVHVREFSVDSSFPRTYKAMAGFRSGNNTIALRFLNDAYLPGIGDCNLFVNSVQYIMSDNKKIEIWNTSEHEYDWLFANNQLIEEHIGMVRRAFPDIPLMVTEGYAGYGINKGTVDRHESRKLKAGLWLAGLLNSMIRKDVAMFNQWKISDSYMGFNLVAPDGHVTPSYYVLKMYAVHVDRRRVDLAVASPTFDAPLLETTAFGKATADNPFVDAVASYDEKGRELSVTAVNRHASSSVRTRIAFGGLKLEQPEATVETLNAMTGDGMEASNERVSGNVAIRTRTFRAEVAGDGIIVDLEPHSLTTVRCAVSQ